MKEVISITTEQDVLKDSTHSNVFCGKEEIQTKMPKDFRTINIEKVLLSKLKAGDPSAFETIFTSYYSDLVLFARRFTHDITNAEEIVQNIFLVLWENRVAININISLKSYLLKTIQNKCIDWYRSKKIRKSYAETFSELPPQLIDDTDSYLLYSELYEKIEKTLDELPKQVSETFRLNRNKGLKYQEIAIMLGVSVRTVEVRIGKALQILRENLKDYFVLILSIFIMMF